MSLRQTAESVAQVTTPVPISVSGLTFMGRKLRINFNHRVETVTTDESEEQIHVYTTACVDKLADRDTIIEAIMQTKYPTYGAELAAIQNGGASVTAHQEMREMAKQLANGWGG